MKTLIFVLSGVILLSSCGNNHIPDVSGIKVDASIARFDKDFFSVDTNHLDQSMNEISAKYPDFFSDFIQNVIIAGYKDTTHNLPLIVTSYINHSRPLYDSVQKKFTSLDDIDAQLQKGFQFVKYYYPNYKLPKLVTYSGLIGDPSVALTKNAMAIGLQMYLGKYFSAYNTPEAIDQFPQYISRRFDAAYIPVNCLQNIASDIYPEKPPGQTMIEQIIEKGKQWYMIDRFLPAGADSLKTGFTQNQLDWCKANEGLIWNNIIQNNDIFTTEPSIIKDLIGEAPTTDGMPAASPGNIGQWVGWQIVKTYGGKNSNLSLQQVLQTDAKKIFEDTKYKPK